ncbi:hypothetical protein F0562_023956 [Nyssa sinensis]|uniref:Nucleotidyl transferase domain-containing protein n=1 Tax=Nyssa sinensis TaxID=561372 RepID=A0A5J5BJA4_9ASTE|nr:hypothetical protein F0562_023956 [Nyssa sinensis]
MNIASIILGGGAGTRLIPLTCQIAKLAIRTVATLDYTSPGIPNRMQDYNVNGRMTSQGLVVEGGGEKKGIVGIVVEMVGIVVGMVGSEVADSGGSVTCGTVGMVDRDGIWNENRDHDNLIQIDKIDHISCSRII